MELMATFNFCSCIVDFFFVGKIAWGYIIAQGKDFRNQIYDVQCLELGEKLSLRAKLLLRFGQRRGI